MHTYTTHQVKFISNLITYVVEIKGGTIFISANGNKPARFDEWVKEIQAKALDALANRTLS